MFESFRSLKMVRPIAIDLIKIVEIHNGVRADVIFVFCSINEFCTEELLLRKIAVQCDKAQDSGNISWNISNLRKHVKQHLEKSRHKASTINENGDCFEDPHSVSQTRIINNVSNNHIEHEQSILSLPILDDTDQSLNENTNKSSNMNSLLYNQFAQQNLRILKSVMENDETTKYMTVIAGNRFMNVRVIKVNGNGNCLFASLINQIHGVKVNSENHQK